MGDFAKAAGSRDPHEILRLYGEMLEDERARYDMGRQQEESAGGVLDPEVTKVSQGLMKGISELIKIVDPSVSQKGRVSVGIVIPSAVEPADPKEVAAAALKSLAAKGVTSPTEAQVLDEIRCITAGSSGVLEITENGDGSYGR